MAVAHKLLVIAFHILRDRTVYQELGGAYYNRRSPERTAKRLARRLEHIGYTVVLTRTATPVEWQHELPTPTPVGTERWIAPVQAEHFLKRSKGAPGYTRGMPQVRRLGHPLPA